MKYQNNNTDYGRLASLDKKYIWHPFTSMKRWSDGDPVIIEAGEGFELIDVNGRRYIDGFSSLWCNLHGHHVREIDEAIMRQLGKIGHSTLLGLASTPSIALGERLVRISPPGLEKVFYSDSGASAVEIALKLAYQYYHNLGRPRRRFLAFREGYHGDTIGAVSVGGIDTFHSLFAPLLFEATFADSPNPFYHPAGDNSDQAVLQQVAEALSSAENEYCAVIVEPMIQGAGGMLTQPAGFMKKLREITTRHDVLLIADEVATGFGRTGRLFACEHEDISPDIMCVGKGLTGGYLPVAATLTTQRVFEAFHKDGDGGTFFHGHTFTGNALGCAAAVASVDLIESSGLVDTLGAKVELLRDRLRAFANHPFVADIRQCGLMIGLDFMQDPHARKRFDAARRVGASICARAVKMGLMIRPLDDVVVLMPAPAMDTQTINRMMDILEAAVDEEFSAV